MWLDLVLTPDPLYGGLGDAQRAGQRSATPARPTLGGPRGLIENLAQHLWVDTPFAAGTRLILKCSQSAFDKTSSPLKDLVVVHTDLLADRPDAQSLSRQLYHSRSLCQPLGGALSAYQLPKLLILSRTQYKLSTPFGHLNIQADIPNSVTII
jgi:hypothetical protein